MQSIFSILFTLQRYKHETSDSSCLIIDEIQESKCGQELE